MRPASLLSELFLMFFVWLVVKQAKSIAIAIFVLLVIAGIFTGIFTDILVNL